MGLVGFTWGHSAPPKGLDTSHIGYGVSRSSKLKLGHIPTHFTVTSESVIVDVVFQVVGDFVGVAFIE